MALENVYLFHYNKSLLCAAHRHSLALYIALMLRAALAAIMAAASTSRRSLSGGVSAGWRKLGGAKYIGESLG